MTWIRGGPTALDSQNITGAIDDRWLIADLWFFPFPVLVICPANLVGPLPVSECRRGSMCSLRRLGVDYIDLYQIHWPDRCLSCVPCLVLFSVCPNVLMGRVLFAAMFQCLERQSMIRAASTRLFQRKSK
jgi:hypothetical protein